MISGVLAIKYEIPYFLKDFYLNFEG